MSIIYYHLLKLKDVWISWDKKVERGVYANEKKHIVRIRWGEGWNHDSGTKLSIS